MDQNLFQDLKRSAKAKFDSLNVELSSIMESNFDSTLTQAVERMERERRTSLTDINLAKQNINRLIDSLAAFREKQLGGKDIIRMQALNESKSRICPLWPIC